MNAGADANGAAAQAEFLRGGGEMGALIRARAWRDTPLGEPQRWPSSLKMAVSLGLSSALPVNIIWGEAHTQLYNDPYRLYLGEAHPRALGECYRTTVLDQWPAIGETFERAFRGDAALIESYRLLIRRTPGGVPEETFLTLSYAPIRDENGDIVGVFHSIVDTTAAVLAERRCAAALGAHHEEHERAERLRRLLADREQLLAAERAARGQAEQANRLKDESLGRLAHEMRTPLSNVRAWLRVLEKRCRRDDELVMRGLAAIEETTKLQAQMISDLLDAARIASGKIRLKLRPCILAGLLESVIVSHRPRAEGKGITLLLNTPAEPLVARVDELRLRQVLTNLLANAIKFTPEGGSVMVGASRVADRAELSVRDTGIGIAREFLPHVFGRLRQAERGRRGGLGLGLAIVKELVELHGGMVRAESAGEDRGTTMRVTLPLEPEGMGAVEELSREGADSSEGRGREPLKDLRILAVEDDTGAREVLTRLLSECGAHVTSCSSCAEALAALDCDIHFDLLLSDLGLSPMDGFALLSAVRERYSPEKLPAIAVSGFTREEDRARAGAVGFQAYIAKPYELAELIALACEWGGRRARV